MGIDVSFGIWLVALNIVNVAFYLSVTRVARGWAKTLAGLVALNVVMMLFAEQFHFRAGDPERFLPAALPLGFGLWLLATVAMATGPFGKRFFAAMLLGTHQLAVIIVCHTLRNHLRPAWIATALACTVMLAMGSFAIMWVMRRIRRMPESVNWGVLNIAVGLLFGLVYASGLGAVYVPTGTWQQATPFVMAVLLLVSFFPVIFNLSEKSRAADRLTLVEDNTRMLLAELKSARAAEEGARRVRHDMRHHIGIVREMVSAGRAKEADEYMANMSGHEMLGAHGSHRWCENPLIDAILAVAERRAAACGKPFRATADVPPALMLQEPDIVALVGNLLENAFLHGAPGEVRLSVALDHGGILRLAVANAVPPGFALVGGLPCETEGVGLTSIRRVVEKYHGVLGYEVRGCELVCKAVIGCG